MCVHVPTRGFALGPEERLDSLTLTYSPLYLEPGRGSSTCVDKPDEGAFKSPDGDLNCGFS
jgi:hypothetical protein